MAIQVSPFVSLSQFVTLRAGGTADWLTFADTTEQLAEAFFWAQTEGLQCTILGSGSNVLPADEGVEGVVIINRANQIEILDQGVIVADTGCLLQELFIKSAQSSLTGLEFAVGIPGTLGGALASNAGAYRNSIGDAITDVEVALDGVVQWCPVSWMQFSYRHSLMRETKKPAFVVTRVRMRLERGSPKDIYDTARKHQVQRISKQPPQASAGSFFKNVNDFSLAQSLPYLPNNLKEAGVVPAGYLIEAVGLKGHRLGGAKFSESHANFIVNIDGAKSTDIRQLAGLARQKVEDAYERTLEEEVLYIGRWPEGEN